MGKFLVKKTATGIKFDLKAGNGEVIGTSEIYTSVKKNAPIAEFEDQTAESVVEAKHPKFEMYLDKAGEYRFRLKARNGEPILASEGYKAKTSCLNGIESVRKNAAEAAVEEKED